jgi:hypothetical protein
MCDIENEQTLQGGMNVRLNQNYTVILMSQRYKAQYTDRVHDDRLTVGYEEHDISKKSYDNNPKFEDLVAA